VSWRASVQDTGGGGQGEGNCQDQASGDGWISQGEMIGKDGEDDRSGMARWHGGLTWKGRDAGGCRASVHLLEDGSGDC
jgi:hypothetical protein